MSSNAISLCADGLFAAETTACGVKRLPETGSFLQPQRYVLKRDNPCGATLRVGLFRAPLRCGLVGCTRLNPYNPLRADAGVFVLNLNLMLQIATSSLSMARIVNYKPEFITSQIYLIREQKVMLDSDLAVLFGVTTARLNQQVNRNR